MDRRGPDLCGCSPGRTNQTSNHGSAQRGSCLMYVRVVVGLAVLILGSTGGEIAITHGMKSVGEPARLRPGAVVEFLGRARSEEHTSELQSRLHLVCRLLLEKKKKDKVHVDAVIVSQLQ